MRFLEKLIGQFRRKMSPQAVLEESRLMEAAKAYGVAFDATEPLTLRGLSVDESSAFLLDPAELARHEEAILRLQGYHEALKEAFNKTDASNIHFKRMGEHYGHACAMHEQAITAFLNVALKTNIIALKMQFNATQQKIAPERQGSADAVDLEKKVEELKQLAGAAERALEKAEELQIDIGVSRNYVKQLLEAET